MVWCVWKSVSSSVGAAIVHTPWHIPVNSTTINRLQKSELKEAEEGEEERWRERDVQINIFQQVYGVNVERLFVNVTASWLVLLCSGSEQADEGSVSRKELQNGGCHSTMLPMR